MKNPNPRYVDVQSFEHFWVPVMCLLEGYMQDGDANDLTKKIYERLGGVPDQLWREDLHPCYRCGMARLSNPAELLCHKCEALRNKTSFNPDGL